jgi:hypothetical protein
VFNGTNPNGLWQLFVFDNAAGFGEYRRRLDVKRDYARASLVVWTETRLMWRWWACRLRQPGDDRQQCDLHDNSDKLGTGNCERFNYHQPGSSNCDICVCNLLARKLHEYRRGSGLLLGTLTNGGTASMGVTFQTTQPERWSTALPSSPTNRTHVAQQCRQQ